MAQQPIEVCAAPLRIISKLFNVPLRHLEKAAREGELRTYCTGGKVSVAIISEVTDWLRTRPAPTRQKRWGNHLPVMGADHAAE